VKIQTRTLLIIGVMLFALIFILAIVAQYVVMSSYSAVEAQESATNVRLVTGLIQSDIETLGESIHSLAVSDAANQYMAGNNPGYLQSQIETPSFRENMQVDGVLFYSTSGTLVSSAWFGDQGTEASNLSRETIAYISANPDLLPDPSGVFPSGVKRQQGLILLPGGPVMVAMHTILSGSAGGDTPSHGTFVVIRSFNQERITALQQNVNLPIRISALGHPVAGGSPVTAPLSKPGDLPVTYRIENESTITGSTLITDIRNRPILLLEVETPRHLHQQALSSMNFILISFILIGVFCAIATVLLMDRYIITHLIDLDRRMKDIGKRRDLSGRIPLTGDDEISSLKCSLNLMLADLENNQEALAEANRRANLYLDINLDVLTYEILNSTIAIRAYTELIADNGGKENERYVSRIIDIISRDREVIKNIETISSIYKTPPACVPVNLEDIIKKGSISFPAVNIRCEQCAVTVLADEKLEMVFFNIISNSVKYGGPQTEITISTRPIDNETLEISVTDTGKGISDTMKPLVFDRFMKDTDRRGSYGLGLHIVKMLIEAYGGRVRADDRVAGHRDQGAAIRFTLKKG
jgi:signal transduction histidine kinase